MMRRAVGTVLLIVLGLALWAVTLFAFGRGHEDFCSTSAAPDVGSWSGAVGVFPPAFDCRYGLLDGGTRTESHPSRAFVYFAVVVLFPIIYLAGVALMLRTGRRRTSRGA